MRSCSVPGCERPLNGRGLCQLHCRRLRNGTDMLAPVGFRHGFALAFIDKAVAYSGTDCLIWPYRLKPEGYGDVRYPGIPGTAARVVCILAHGAPLEKDLDVAHWCGTPACIAPKHLRWATASENMMDRLRHGTDNRGAKHGMSKLTEADVLEIRAQPWRKGTELAAEYGVRPTTICCIRNRRSWAWLED